MDNIERLDEVTDERIKNSKQNFWYNNLSRAQLFSVAQQLYRIRVDAVFDNGASLSQGRVVDVQGERSSELPDIVFPNRERSALVIHIENDSSGILRSRGHNFLFKNVEIFEIRQKFAEIGRFEFGISRETADFLDFP